MRPIDADALFRRISREMERGKLYLPVDLQEMVTSEPTVDVEPTQKWISVKDRLPEVGVLVLVAYDFELIEIGGGMKYVDTAMLQDFGFCGGGYDKFIDAKICRTAVTHWMPMPEPPMN